ncbi:hypothetical protein D8S78_14855 [Natrialba swarupiae]|nr:hypothetical protein [Natrialba swarupiae]
MGRLGKSTTAKLLLTARSPDLASARTLINSRGHWECVCTSQKWAGADDAEYEDQQQRERFAQRREDANIPDDIEHRTKLEIAAGLVEHVVSADIEHGCVVADQNYGKSRSFRQKLRGLDEPYHQYFTKPLS